MKIYEFLKKYKIIVITALGVIILGVCAIVIYGIYANKNPIKELATDSYSLEYNRAWKIKEKEENKIVLEHNTGSKVTIQVSELTNEYEYLEIDDFIDEIIYNIQSKNEEYKLLSTTEEELTENKFRGYKLLLENENNNEQTMVSTYKASNKLVTFIYEANNDYFDILLDSVDNIIYNFSVKEEKFDLKNEIALNSSEIKYNTNEELDKKLKKSTTYEIAKNNYLVKYSIPSNFTLNSFDSTLNYFSLELDEGKIDITVDLLNRNIYEYLDKDESVNVFKNYESYKENEEYSSFDESISELESKYDSYIYKNSYYYDNAVKYDSDFNEQKYKRLYENVELIYALNNNHTLKITLSASDTSITEKLINMIKIESIKNYSSYIKVEEENNLKIGRLRRFLDSTKEKFEEVKIKLPLEYKEIDNNSNIYLERHYVLNYNDDKEIYDYEINYNLSNLSTEKTIIDNINSSKIKTATAYGSSKQLTYSGELTLNSKQFTVYDGGYTDVSGIIFTNIDREKYYVNKKVLLYKMPTKGFLYIEIDGNGKGITEKILNDITNFSIEEKKY